MVKKMEKHTEETKETAVKPVFVPIAIAQVGIQYHEKGYWVKCWDQIAADRFSISVYYIPIVGPVVPGYWSRQFVATKEEAKSLFDKIDSLDRAKQLLLEAPVIKFIDTHSSKLASDK
jgi:hypothetical protein